MNDLRSRHIASSSPEGARHGPRRHCAIVVSTLVGTLSCTCAIVPRDVSRGELVVATGFREPLFKAFEIQHQRYDHAESITGFDSDGTSRKSVIAGEYCAERMVFDSGAAGGDVRPEGPCFFVPAQGTTTVWLLVDANGHPRVCTEPMLDDLQAATKTSEPKALLLTGLDHGGEIIVSDGYPGGDPSI